MKKIIFIADFFADQVFGGGELVNEEIIKGLEKSGITVEKINSENVRRKHLTNSHNRQISSDILIGNFIGLSEDIKKYIQTYCYYSIIEHDHKYVEERDVTAYKEYLVPPNKIINKDFYKCATTVYCQSKLHSDVVSKNIGLNNVVNLSTSIWSDEHLDLIESYCDREKNNKTTILGSDNIIKNTGGCIDFCNNNNIEHDIVGPLPYKELMDEMSNYKEVIILPGVLETFNRFLVEARMLGLAVKTNDRNGCTSEEWFPKLKGRELINFIRASKDDFIEKFISKPKYYKAELPLISIITSMYKGKKHLKLFLDNIISQTAFDYCELIIINANSPENEDDIIKPYLKKYKNIIYKKLNKDPGIYGCWNEAIKLSKGKYITNANLDDRRADTHIEHHVRFLEKNKDIDLAYSEAYLTEKDFEHYYANSSQGRVYHIHEFSNENMVKCLPGCMPVWRKSIHKNIGLFDESYKSAGDWEMWLRAVRNGSKFQKLDGIYGMYYMNPNGLSTDSNTQNSKIEEEKNVFNTYKDIFGKNAYNYFSRHFNKVQNLCTVSDINYLSQGIALYESLLSTSKDFILHYLCIDDESYRILSKIEKNIKVYHIDEFIKKDNKLKNIRDNNYQYFCWLLASYFSNKLINNYNSITYIDSDIYFHKDIDLIFNEIGNKDVGIFRHRQFDLQTQYNEGKYNVGIVHFKNSEDGRRTLWWWADAVLNKKYPELATCGDQRYLDKFPTLCKNIYIDENIGHGAPWQWQLYDILDNGDISWNGKQQPLVFTHFSQFEITKDSYTPSKMHHIYTPLKMYKENKNLNLIYENYYTQIKKIISFYMS